MTVQAAPFAGPDPALGPRVRTRTGQRLTLQLALALGAIVLLLWTVFPFFWILLTSFKTPGDIISVPPKVVFSPTFANYMALVIGEQHGQVAASRPDFPLFFLNSTIISLGSVLLSLAAGIPAAYALARFEFPFKNAIAFVLMSFRFVPFIAFVIPLYILYQKIGLYNTHGGLILAYQLITLPFTIWMLRSFFLEIPLEIQEAAKIDGCSWLGVLVRVVLPLSMPGLAVTMILGFMFCWNAFNYPLMLAGRQTFPVTVGAIQFISYEQVLWGQMAAATVVAALPQLVLSLMVQKYIVRGLTMGAVK
jgi:multiple sugar transport system permease protein